jgi:hypothetical protein
MLGNLIIGCAVIMALIVIACLVTPKIAAWLEKKYPKLKEDPKDRKSQNPEDYKVNGIFEASKLDDFDPNYKIYNKDIYGVDFKHGKTKKDG